MVLPLLSFSSLPCCYLFFFWAVHNSTAQVIFLSSHFNQDTDSGSAQFSKTLHRSFTARMQAILPLFSPPQWDWSMPLKLIVLSWIRAFISPLAYHQFFNSGNLKLLVLMKISLVFSPAPFLPQQAFHLSCRNLFILHIPLHPFLHHLQRSLKTLALGHLILIISREIFFTFLECFWTESTIHKS